MGHDHDHDHPHPHAHEHGHRHERWEHPGRFSDREAPRDRDYRARAFTVGIGGPVGSGKTALLLALCRALRDRYRLGVVTNDIFTREDAEFLTRNEALPAAQIRAVETGGCPHAAIREDITPNLSALEDLMKAVSPELLFVESGGDNLAAQYSRELVDFTIYVIDVAGGDKVPRKGGPGITQSDLLVVNKTDLAPHVGADLAVMERDARAMRGDGPTVFAQATRGVGLATIEGEVLAAWRKVVPRALSIDAREGHHAPNEEARRHRRRSARGEERAERRVPVAHRRVERGEPRVRRKRLDRAKTERRAVEARREHLGGVDLVVEPLELGLARGVVDVGEPDEEAAALGVDLSDGERAGRTEDARERRHEAALRRERGERRVSLRMLVDRERAGLLRRRRRPARDARETCSRERREALARVPSVEIRRSVVEIERERGHRWSP